MVEEPRTKDVFRELDGFLVMVSMLSALALPEVQGSAIVDPEQRMEVTRLAFAIISEAMRDHCVNSIYFNVRTSHFPEHINQTDVSVLETSWLWAVAAGCDTADKRPSNIRSDHGIFARTRTTKLFSV